MACGGADALPRSRIGRNSAHIVIVAGLSRSRSRHSFSEILFDMCMHMHMCMHMCMCIVLNFFRITGGVRRR